MNIIFRLTKIIVQLKVKMTLLSFPNKDKKTCTK